ncbi:MAG: rubrerythrin family protein [Anaerolineae bacterium]
MKDMTKSNLQSAYSGESQAHMRYMIWAGKAMKDGFANVARLFSAVSVSEQVHATSHFMVLKNEVGGASDVAGAGFGYGPTAQNVKVALGGEEFEIAEMYPVYKAAAEFQSEKPALVSFSRALEAEKVHAELYRKALAATEANKDMDLGTVYICQECGYTFEGSAPDTCPICKAKRETFSVFA